MKQAEKPRVYAFIDSQNLNLGVQNDVQNSQGKLLYAGKRLDFKKFRDYLAEKYNVHQAYLFIGFVPAHGQLYTALQQAGYILIFKEIVSYFDAKGALVTKGNVDTDIVLYAAAKMFQDYDQAIFASGDGDFLSLYEYLEEKNKLQTILVPNRFRYSKLLNKYRSKLRFVSDIQPVFMQHSKVKKHDAVGGGSKGQSETNKKTRSGGRR